MKCWGCGEAIEMYNDNNNNFKKSKWNLIQQYGAGRREYGKRLRLNPLWRWKRACSHWVWPEPRGNVSFFLWKIELRIKVMCIKKCWIHEAVLKSPIPAPQEEQEAARRRQQRENKSNTTTPTKIQENKVSILHFCALCVSWGCAWAHALSQEQPASVGRLLACTLSTQTALAVAVPKNMMEWVNKSCTWELHH